MTSDRAWFLTHDPVATAHDSAACCWKDWPDRWGADAVIRPGRRRCHRTSVGNPGQADHMIAKRDVDTFLSESGRSEFSFRGL